MTSKAWQKLKLDDLIISANTGLDAIKRAPIVAYDSGIKCLRIQDVSQQKVFNDWGFCEVTDHNYTRFRLKKDDIMIARTGATVGSNKIIASDLNSVYNNGLIRIRVNETKILPQYLYYLFQDQQFHAHVKAIAIGTSTQPNMKIQALLDFAILVPDLFTQKRIAKLLSVLDEKIELNRQTNATLEAMGQAIFKEWFVNYNFPGATGELVESGVAGFGRIPAGWRIDTLGEILQIKGGTTPRTREDRYWNGDIHWATPKDLSKLNSPVLLDTNRKITKEGLAKISSGLLPKGTLLFSSRAPIGYLAIAEIPLAINQGFIAIQARRTSNQFMLYWLQEYLERVKSRANGSTFLEISKTNFRKIKLIVPDQSVIVEFDKHSTVVYEAIKKNEQQNLSLAKTRDTLLPKLMRGEIALDSNPNATFATTSDPKGF